MNIGIIGAGQVGRALAKKLIRAGYSIIISNSRGPESLQPIAMELGMSATAGNSEDAAGADIVILAVMWWDIPNVLMQVKDRLSGKIVIDVSNYFPKDGKFEKLEKPTGVMVAEMIPEAKIVKAFNHLYGKWIEAEPEVENGKRVSFISGDHTEANQVVKTIISAFGFQVVELGGLAYGGSITDIGAPLSGLNLVSYPIA